MVFSRVSAHAHESSFFTEELKIREAEKLDMKGLKAVAKEADDELTFGEKKNKGKEIGKGEKKSKVYMTDLNFTTAGPAPGSREERGGDRGNRGGKGRGGESRGGDRGGDRGRGRGGQGAGGAPRGPRAQGGGGGGKNAINLEDANAFPSLG
jgi:hypothetical protein